MPETTEELAWLRNQKIDILICLTEEPVRRSWIDEAGLMLVHLPVPDMEPPSQEQFDKAVRVIDKARAANMGVCVHCWAGRGRTGTLLAAYFVSQGLSAEAALARTRELRPGSVEVRAQERAVREFASRQARPHTA